MKHYTSIEQSKKLLELGLSSETADMYYCEEYIGENNDHFYTIPPRIGSTKYGNLPCWSLGALLDLMPKEITDKEGTYYKLLIDVKAGFPKYYSTSYEIYHEDFPYPIGDECKTLFEYVVEGVIWLLENGYIKQESNTSSK